MGTGGFGARGGDACKPFPLLSAGRGLGKSLVTLGAQSCLPFPAACPPPAACPESSHIPWGLHAFPSSLEEHSEGLDASFPPGHSCHQQGLSESIPQGRWGLHLGSLAGTGSLLCCCPDPTWPQGQGPCLGVSVTTCRVGEQSSVQQPPWKGFCSLLPFRMVHNMGWAAGSPQLLAW